MKEPDEFEDDFFEWYDSEDTQTRFRHAQHSPRDEAFAAAAWASRYIRDYNTPATVFRLEDAVGEIVLCTDGRVRKMRTLDGRSCTYSVRILDDMWKRVVDVRMEECEKLFVGGKILKSYAEEV